MSSDHPPVPPAAAGESPYLDPYRDAVSEHGAGFSATLWGSEKAQRLRFDVMHAMLPLTDLRIADLGCGQGDLAVHLAERGIPIADYLGIDAMAPMVAEARTRGIAGARFEVADLLRDDTLLREARADVTCISGMLNTMTTDDARRMVGGAFDAARVGVVFNFLSDRPHKRWHGRDLTPAWRFDTLDWLNWALGRSSRVRLDQAYLDGHDATIVILHEP